MPCGITPELSVRMPSTFRWRANNVSNTKTTRLQWGVGGIWVGIGWGQGGEGVGLCGKGREGGTAQEDRNDLKLRCQNNDK